MFHRLVTPLYFGGLPATHDEINNVTGPGTPAPVSAQQSGGLYDGTYFEVPTETATATNVNRGNKALAENSDFIDDILNTSRPVFAFEDFVAGGPGGDTQIQITGDGFVGRSGVAPITQQERDFLIAIVNPSDMRPVLVAGAPVTASDIRDSGDSANVIGTEATGYHTDPIVVFSATIPAAIAYRLVYFRRGTVTKESDPIDATGDMGYTAGLILKALTSGGSSVSMGFVAGATDWADTTNLTSLNVRDAIREIVSDLAAQGAGDDGAGRVGAEAHTAAGNGLIDLSVGSTGSQLIELSDAAAAHALAQTISGSWTFDETGGIIAAGATQALQMTATAGLGLLGPTGAYPLTLSAGNAAGGRINSVGGVLKVVWDAATWDFQATDVKFGSSTRVYNNADGGGAAPVHLGVSPTASEAYLRRFGRVHAAWSHYREDFLLGATAADFPHWIFSAGAAAGGSDDDGIIVFTTGASIGNNEAIEGQGAHFTRGGSRQFIFETIIRFETAITTVILAVGVTSQSGTNPDGGGDGCWVRYDTDIGDANWVLAGSAAGSITTSAASVAPVGGTFVRVTIAVAADGSAEMFINGVSEATIAAGSVGSASNMRPMFYVETRTTAARLASLDKFEIWQSPVI